MSTVEAADAGQPSEDSQEQRVSPLELFFDLVFVFALTQVTAFLAAYLTWGGVLRGTALLAALWWAWASYSWLTNAVPAHEAILARLIVLSTMVAMLVASLAVPGAFGEYGVIFGVSYFVVRLLMVVLYVCPPPAARPRRAVPSSGSLPASWAVRRCSSWPGSSTASPRALSGL